MYLNRKFTYMWILWILIFLIIEICAIVDEKKGDTLSEHLWQWFGVKYTGKYYRWLRFIGVTFIGWFSLHILTGGWI